jgi:hypothetical protein
MTTLRELTNRLFRTRVLLLAFGAVALTAGIALWPFWSRQVSMHLSALSRLILAFAHRHPHAARFLHVSLEAIPDLASVLLAIAGMSYLMPGLIHKFEESKALRLSAVVVFFVIGVAAVIMNSVNREDQKNQQELDRNKIDVLGVQVHDALQFLIQSKGTPNEVERRKHILDTLRSEYILAHPEASATMIAGTADPPPGWINKRLRELGEQWPYVRPLTPEAAFIPRSYVVWSGQPRFAGGSHEGDPIAVGQPIGFNVSYKQTGPNQVDIVQNTRWLYVESDSSIKSQNSVIEDFKDRVRSTNRMEAAYTLSPGDSPHFFSAVAVENDGRFHVATKQELDKLKLGQKVIFILAQITYIERNRDSKKEHHLPLCVYLQPPASPPGIWHFCDEFSRSD